MIINRTNIVQLDNAIKEVCPIDGISSDGKIDFREEATEPQREAARAIMAEFVAAPEVGEGKA